MDTFLERPSLQLLYILKRIVRISAISSISATRVSPLENTMSALKGHLLGCLLIILTRTRVKFTELSYLRPKLDITLHRRN